MVDSGRVDDPRCVLEALAVERRGGEVQSLVVEGFRQLFLVEVAADDRHVVDRRDGRDAQAAERSDQAASCGLGERQVVDGRRENVGDLLRDQLLGRSHADVQRLVVRADRLRRLLAERRVRLVGDHEVVRVARDLVVVPREPRVRLDRDRVLSRRLLATHDRVGETIAVALLGEVAVELLNEEAAVREDQHAERARGFDEARGRDRLAGRRRVAEAETARRTRIRPRVDVLVGVLVGLALEQAELVLRLLLDRLRDLDDRCVPVAVAVLDLALVRVQELGEHPRERVDLMSAELGLAGRELRARLDQHALEAEHQPVLDLPGVRRSAQAVPDLGSAPRRARACGRSPARAPPRRPRRCAGTLRPPSPGPCALLQRAPRPPAANQ